MMTDLELATKVARCLVRAGPQLTGFAKPRCWWVYLGDHCIDGHSYTQEEAERAAAVHHPNMIAFLLWALRLSRRTEEPVLKEGEELSPYGFSWGEWAELNALIVEQNRAVMKERGQCEGT
jgi:hypothetical protein